ncbi:MAG: hypothetical protein K2Q28_17390, partial [Hyphomicrobium sp.]|nr:hypothetical protein [Hyphomicrobium sp.]
GRSRCAIHRAQTASPDARRRRHGKTLAYIWVRSVYRPRLAGIRLEIAEELATRSEPSDEPLAVELVEALLATATPLPTWAVQLVTKKAA